MNHDALRRSQSMAKALRKALAMRQIDLSAANAHEVVPQQHGISDGNVLKSRFAVLGYHSH
ncbi:glyoxalase superfamily protein [Mesorhizobium cantuariense]|uniref:Glyoxalase superfamily protein n=2 Tax=Mesorhizobium TaxID=68287 RepID=A0ABV7MGG5_9HYPH